MRAFKVLFGEKKPDLKRCLKVSIRFFFLQFIYRVPAKPAPVGFVQPRIVKYVIILEIRMLVNNIFSA